METKGRLLLGRSISEWLFGLPIFLLLAFTLLIGTGEMLHGKLLKVGEAMFGHPEIGVQYFMLRDSDPTPPTCKLITDVDAEVQRQLSAAPSQSEQDMDNLFGDQAPLKPEDIKNSILSANQLCQEEIDNYNKVAKLQTTGLRAYRAFETGFFKVFRVGTENRPLILLLMVALAAIITTRGSHHVVIRPPTTVLDYRVSSAAIGIASILAEISSISYYRLSSSAGIAIEHPLTHYIWIALFLVLAGISLKQIVFPPAHLKRGGSLGQALLSIPLFGMMGMITGGYFFAHGNWPELAIYINQLLELPSIFLSLSLYIWAGMLLKQSSIVDLLMNTLRPWKLSPELLTYIILLIAALPTAYTGASGIFVIAAGGIVYHEVRQAGGTRQFALAATAMSGSLGVVLRPCLLVVLIAALNKQVTSSALYHWGFFVFLLTSTLFLIFSQITRRKRAAVERPLVAIPKMMKEMVPVVPFFVVIGLVVLGYEYLLDSKLNESTAPVIMPTIMLFLLVFDKLRAKKDPQLATLEAEIHKDHSDHRQEGVERSIRYATNEAIGHIGALIMLMAMSLAVGGLVERSGVMSLAPTHFSSPWAAMTFLMITKVILGMVMDPFGAVILVSGTLAPIAYSNGINPIHFWMMVLVAFELGYLMPPVALNQLLTRLVIGEDEVSKADHEVRNKSFYWRYERWILPTAVMTVGLLVTAYLPLAVEKFDALKPLAHIIAPAESDVGGSAPPADASSAATPAAAPAVAPAATDNAPAAPAAPAAASSDTSALDAATPAAATPAATPAPAAPAPAAAGSNAMAEVQALTDQWAQAWESKNVDAYLAFYAPDFKAANGETRPKWDAARKRLIEGKKSIQVELSNVQVHMDGDNVVVAFDQSYSSDHFKDETKKLLTWKQVDGRWLIVSETASH